MERPAVVRRALLDEIAVLDHLLHVVGDVRAEVVAALGELADGELLLADVEQDQRLDVVQVADALAVEVGLDDLEALAVEPLRSEEHTSELQSLLRISCAVFCLNK